MIDYLTYDEIQISALLVVSSYSYIINDGSRYNGGKSSTGMLGKERRER
jgi:hypothetical protein